MANKCVSGRPRTPLGSLQCSPDPLSGLRGPTSKGRGGERGGTERKGEGGKEREGNTSPLQGEIEGPGA